MSERDADDPLASDEEASTVSGASAAESSEEPPRVSDRTANNFADQLNALLDRPVFDPDNREGDEPRLLGYFREKFDEDPEYATTLYVGGYFALLLCFAQQGVRIFRHCYFQPDKLCPWEARLQAPEGTPYHTAEGFRVQLLVDENYPLTPPEVTFMQIVHHFFLDNDNQLPSIFYDLLSDLVGDLAGPDEPPQHTLRATLQLAAHVLRAPLHPCDGCQSQFEAYAKMHAERLEVIADYVPFRAHPALFDAQEGWSAEWLHPELRSALYGDSRGGPGDGVDGRDGRLRALLHECAEGVYAFPCLTEEACAMLVGEVDAYAASGLPTARPNSMNKYGLVLNEVGMEPTFDSLQTRVLAPIAKLLFPLEGGSLDRHHSFVVQYQEGKDLGLDMHTDNSDVTFNICLGRDFEGAGLTFCGYMGAAHHRHFSYRHRHVKGHCVVHLGRRRHGADEISSGERLNLIIWNTNLAHRNSAAYMELQRQHRYEREASAPDLVCLSYTHDRDYLKYREKPSQHAKMSRRGWCPPLFAQHDAPSTPTPATREVLDGGTLRDGDDGGDAATTLADTLEIQRVLNALGDDLPPLAS